MTLQKAFEMNKPFKFSFMIEGYNFLINSIGGVDSIKRLLEIGIWEGNSLRMWYDAMPNARIYGIDKIACTSCQNDRIETFVADQAEAEQTKRIGQSISPLDIIIDDGSHRAKDQLSSFFSLYQFVRQGGVYVCEDNAYSYDVQFAPQGQPTLLGFAKEVGCCMQVEAIDLAIQESPELDTNVIHCEYVSNDEVKRISSMTSAVMFFHNLVVFRKK